MEIVNLPEKIRRLVEDFVKSLEDAYKDELVSVALYGSAATKEFTKYSNVNLLIVLKDTGLENLKRIVKLVNKDKFSLINPVFFTEKYIERSLDVFPIEFLDMKENHLTIYGKDILRDIELSVKNLRFQCEQELKSKLINIKRDYLKTNKYNLKSLLFSSLTSTLHILRNLLRLKGKIPSCLKEDLLKELNQEFQIDTTSFSKILQAKTQNLRLSYKELDNLICDFVSELEKIIEIVDAI